MLGGPQSRYGRRGEENLFTLPGLKLRSLGRPIRSQSQYRLRYPGSLVLGKGIGNHVLPLPCVQTLRKWLCNA
jgi:hypothetical protein